MAKGADAVEIVSKKYGGDLWKDIREMWQSKRQPSYEQIRSMLMLEYGLSDFPSKRTVERRIKSEGWKRAEVDTAKAMTKYDDDFWIVVKTVYEANPKISHKKLSEMVQNELQIDYFPTRQAVAAKAKAEGWQNAKDIVNSDDAALRKLKKTVKRSIKTDTTIDISDSDDDDGDGVNLVFIGDGNTDPEDESYKPFLARMTDDDFAKMDAVREFTKTRIKSVLTSQNGKKLKLIDVILKGRNRMRTINEIGDMLSDRMMELYLMNSSPEILRLMSDDMRQAAYTEYQELTRLLSHFNDLSFSRRESIKFELSLYGIIPEDLRDNDDSARIVDMNDETAMEQQRQRLMEQRQKVIEMRQFIESGGMERKANEIMQERMAEMDLDGDEEYEDADFTEIE